MFVVLRISLQDLMDSSIIIGSKIERSIDIVIRSVVVLKNIRKLWERAYLLGTTNMHATHGSLEK